MELMTESSLSLEMILTSSLVEGIRATEYRVYLVCPFIVLYLGFYPSPMTQTPRLSSFTIVIYAVFRADALSLFMVFPSAIGEYITVLFISCPIYELIQAGYYHIYFSLSHC